MDGIEEYQRLAICSECMQRCPGLALGSYISHDAHIANAMAAILRQVEENPEGWNSLLAEQHWRVGVNRTSMGDPLFMHTAKPVIEVPTGSDASSAEPSPSSSSMASPGPGSGMASSSSSFSDKLPVPVASNSHKPVLERANPTGMSGKHRHHLEKNAACAARVGQAVRCLALYKRAFGLFGKIQAGQQVGVLPALKDLKTVKLLQAVMRSLGPDAGIAPGTRLNPEAIPGTVAGASPGELDVLPEVPPAIIEEWMLILGLGANWAIKADVSTGEHPSLSIVPKQRVLSALCNRGVFMRAAQQQQGTVVLTASLLSAGVIQDPPDIVAEFQAVDLQCASELVQVMEALRARMAKKGITASIPITAPAAPVAAPQAASAVQEGPLTAEPSDLGSESSANRLFS